ncbi:MAG: flagellar basal body rod protein FlgB [Gammaproteobacteria bacterium]|nr:flagellar basal body rod protein FlgB [Gammaproteobacteria bacterium]
MKISFENALGVHADALALRSKRLEVLASNLVNADTPGYKARDIDFRTALNEASSTADASQLKTTRAGHISLGSGISNINFEVQYRIPTQPSRDGNTVEAEVEQAEFARNATQYQASLQFLGGRFQGLRKAITGE